MRDGARPWAVAIEVVGWSGLAATSAIGAWLLVATYQVCDQLEPLEGVHGGCGYALVFFAVLLAVDAVLWIGSLLLVVAGRRWRRPRRATTAPPAPPTWWYDPYAS